MTKTPHDKSKDKLQTWKNFVTHITSRANLFYRKFLAINPKDKRAKDINR